MNSEYWKKYLQQRKEAEEARLKQREAAEEVVEDVVEEVVEELVERGMVEEDQADELVDELVEDVMEDAVEDNSGETPAEKVAVVKIEKAVEGLEVLDLDCECKDGKLRNNGTQICRDGNWVKFH